MVKTVREITYAIEVIKLINGEWEWVVRKADGPQNWINGRASWFAKDKRKDGSVVADCQHEKYELQRTCHHDKEGLKFHLFQENQKADQASVTYLFEEKMETRAHGNIKKYSDKGPQD